MTQPSFAEAWAAQWRAADAALERVAERELASLSSEAALVASDTLLALADPRSLTAERLLSSGLVEQQRLLASLRRRR